MVVGTKGAIYATFIMTILAYILMGYFIFNHTKHIK